MNLPLIILIMLSAMLVHKRANQDAVKYFPYSKGFIKTQQVQPPVPKPPMLNGEKLYHDINKEYEVEAQIRLEQYDEDMNPTLIIHLVKPTNFTVDLIITRLRKQPNGDFKMDQAKVTSRELDYVFKAIHEIWDMPMEFPRYSSDVYGFNTFLYVKYKNQSWANRFLRDRHNLKLLQPLFPTPFQGQCSKYDIQETYNIVIPKEVMDKYDAPVRTHVTRRPCGEGKNWEETYFSDYEIARDEAVMDRYQELKPNFDRKRRFKRIINYIIKLVDIAQGTPGDPRQPNICYVNPDKINNDTNYLFKFQYSPVF